MFHTATVRPTRSGPRILYNTSLRKLCNRVIFKHIWLVISFIFPKPCWSWVECSSQAFEQSTPWFAHTKSWLLWVYYTEILTATFLRLGYDLGYRTLCALVNLGVYWSYDFIACNYWNTSCIMKSPGTWETKWEQLFVIHWQALRWS